jgi:hypothetical protein
MGNFLLGLFGNLLAAEIGAWCRGLAGQIVCATARKLPEKLQPRMREEWSALLEDIPGDLSKLWMAISLYRKRSKLTEECEECIQQSLPPLLGLDTLTGIERAVFDLNIEGKTNGQISYLLGVDEITVQYRTITAVQKLTGQSSVGRDEMLKFLGARKNPRNQTKGILRRFRREMGWCQMKRDGGMKRNGGW